MKILAVVFMLSLFVCGAMGCETVGYVSGSAVQEVKEVPSEVEEGYEKGKADAAED